MKKSTLILALTIFLSGCLSSLPVEERVAKNTPPQTHLPNLINANINPVEAGLVPAQTLEKSQESENPEIAAVSFHITNIQWTDNSHISSKYKDRLTITFTEKILETGPMTLSPGNEDFYQEIEQNKLLLIGNFEAETPYILKFPELKSETEQNPLIPFIEIPLVKNSHQNRNQPVNLSHKSSDAKARLFSPERKNNFFHTLSNVPDFYFKKSKKIPQNFTLCRINLEKSDNIFTQTPLYFQDFEKDNIARTAEQFKYLNENKRLPKDIKKSDCTETYTQKISFGENHSFTIPTENIIRENFTQKSGLFVIYWGEENLNLDSKYFGIINTSLFLKQGQNEALIFATDLGDSTPLKNQKIYLKNFQYPSRYAKDGPENPAKIFGITDQEWSTTNKRGIAENTISEEISHDNLGAILYTDDHFGVVFNEWSDGLNNYNFPLEENLHWEEREKSKSKILGHAYSEKMLYRPGQTIHYKALFRQRNPELNTLDFPKDIREIRLRFSNSEGEEVSSQDLSLSETGAIAANFFIPPNAALGTWDISATPLETKVYERETIKTPVYRSKVYLPIEVQAYRLPEFKIDTFTDDYQLFGEDQTITLKISAKEYSGSPLARGRIEYRLIGRTYFIEEQLADTYQYPRNYSKFYHNDYRNQTHLKGEEMLDENGEFTLEIPLQKEMLKGNTAQSLSLEINVYDDQNREVSDTRSFRYFAYEKEEAIPGIKVEKSFYQAGQEIPIEVIAQNIIGEKIPNTSYNLKIFQEKTTCKEEKRVHKGIRKDCQKSTEEIYSEKIKTDKNGISITHKKIAEPGEYQIKILNEEGTLLQKNIRVFDTQKSIPATDTLDNRYLDIMLDKDLYQEGQTAQILITSPYPKSTALITLEANDIITSDVVQLETYQLQYPLKISPELIPNAYISATIIEKPQDKNEIPHFKIGYKNIAVDPSSQKLNIQITPNKTDFRPGEKIILDIKTTDKNQIPIAAEISLAVVDEAILRLGGSPNTNFLKTFFSRRLLFIKNAFSLVGLHDDTYFTTYGGGGKGGGLSYQVPPVRKNFDEVPFYQANLQTDKRGSAQVEFIVPDKLTSFLIHAAGYGQKSQIFGNAETSFTVAKEFFVSPVLPRFFRKNDEIELVVRIYNLTEEPQNITTKIEGEGFDLYSSETIETPNLDPSSYRDVSYRLTIHDQAEKATIRFLSQSENYQDAVQHQIPILGYNLFNRIENSDILSSEKPQSQIEIPPYVNPQKGALSLSISDLPQKSLAPRLQKLLSYPYGCAEQTISTTVPNAIILPLSDGELKIKAEKNLQAGLERLQKFQRSDGGFSLWEDASQSSSYVSSIVGKGLAQIHQSGFEIPSEMRAKFLQYLEQKLTYQSTNRYYNDHQNLSEHLKLDFIYIAHTLEPQEKYQELATTYFYKLPQLKPQEKRKVASIILQQNSKDPLYQEKHKILQENIKNSLIEEDGKFIIMKQDNNSEKQRDHFYPGNTITELSDFFRVLIQLDPENPNISKILQQILDTSASDFGYFSSYQEKARFLALADYTKSQKKSAEKLQKIILKINQKPYEMVLGDKLEIPLEKIFKSSSSVHKISLEIPEIPEMYYLDYAIDYTIDDITKIAPQENKLAITRTITNLNGEEIHPDQLHTGDHAEITLSVDNIEKASQVVLTDHLPANWEFVNPPKHAKNFVRLDFRDDRLDAFLDDYARDAFIKYKIRVITEGEWHYPPAYARAMYTPSTKANSEGQRIDNVQKFEITEQ